MPSLDFKNPRRTGGAPGTTLSGAGKYVLLLALFALSSLYYLAGTAPETTESETANETVVETAANLGLAPTLPLLPEHETVTGEIARGEAFSEALKTAGISHEAVFELVKALRKGIQRADFNPNIVQRGDRFSAITDNAAVIQEFEYIKRGALEARIVARREDGKLRAWKEEVPLDRQIVVVTEKLDDSIWNALRSSGKNPDVLSSRLTDIFEYEIDFMVDCRPGDQFSLAFEEFYKDDEFVRYGDILAAEYATGRDRYQAYLYERENGDRSYHDAEGKSLRGIFLKSPLNYRRISSGYTSRRFHPVLKKYLKHHGIDYAASYGTNVWATAEGTVSFIGRKGALGNYIEIKHKNGYKTGYGHLSKFRKGLKKGSRVSQKQVIGYVGATGRATGPHLHYNFYTHSKGEYKLTNPSRVTNRPTGEPVPKTLIADFLQKRDTLYALFDHQSGSIVTAYLEGTDFRNAK
jgi:murein DD-endopeptidase MepM/ murein hydrolase activator NlpD